MNKTRLKTAQQLQPQARQSKVEPQAGRGYLRLQLQTGREVHQCPEQAEYQEYSEVQQKGYSSSSVSLLQSRQAELHHQAATG